MGVDWTDDDGLLEDFAREKVRYSLPVTGTIHTDSCLRAKIKRISAYH
jgi:hypothetical protein